MPARRRSGGAVAPLTCPLASPSPAILVRPAAPRAQAPRVQQQGHRRHQQRHLHRMRRSHGAARGRPRGARQGAWAGGRGRRPGGPPMLRCPCGLGIACTFSLCTSSSKSSSVTPATCASRCCCLPRRSWSLRTTSPRTKSSTRPRAAALRSCSASCSSCTAAPPWCCCTTTPGGTRERAGRGWCLLRLLPAAALCCCAMVWPCGLLLGREADGCLARLGTRREAHPPLLPASRPPLPATAMAWTAGCITGRGRRS